MNATTRVIALGYVVLHVLIRFSYLEFKNNQRWLFSRVRSSNHAYRVAKGLDWPLNHFVITLYTGCSLKIVFFLKILWFFWALPVLLQRWCSTCLVCVHTLTPRENRVRNISINSEKNTIFKEQHPVYKILYRSINLFRQFPLVFRYCLSYSLQEWILDEAVSSSLPMPKVKW